MSRLVLVLALLVAACGSASETAEGSPPGSAAGTGGSGGFAGSAAGTGGSGGFAGSAAGTGGSGGFADAGAPGDCDRFLLEGNVGGESVRFCNSTRMRTIRNDPFDGGWLRVAFFEPGLSAALWIEGSQKPADLVPMSSELALLRMPDAGPLPLHWICSGAGEVIPRMTISDRDTFSLAELTDLGTCEGDPQSADWVRFDFRGLGDFDVAGSIGGQPVNVRVTGNACFVELACTLDIDAEAGGDVLVRVAARNDTGAPVSITDGYWVGPQIVSADVLCAGPGSTLTKLGQETIIELRGLHPISCPGTPIAGALSGML